MKGESQMEKQVRSQIAGAIAYFEKVKECCKSECEICIRQHGGKCPIDVPQEATYVLVALAALRTVEKIEAPGEKGRKGGTEIQ